MMYGPALWSEKWERICIQQLLIQWLQGNSQRLPAGYGSLIKGHYSDNVTNPEAYPESGMGAANVGPEFTEMEYDALSELEDLQQSLLAEGRIGKPAAMRKQLWESVIKSGRWKKWLQRG